MTKLLKTLIILMLLLAITALVFSVMLFGNREILLGRTVKFEAAAANIAKAIRYEELNAANLQDYNAMDAELSKVASEGDLLFNNLEDTKADLARTEDELDNTKQELASTEQELSETRDDLSAAEATIVRKDEQIVEVKGQLSDAEQQNEQLLTQVGDLEDQLLEANDKTLELTDTVEMLDLEIKKLLGNLDTVMVSQNVKPGTSGSVLLVKDDWNFVVIDLGVKDSIAVNTEMMVHRGDQLVGKIRITSIEDEMAVGDIIRDWSQEEIQQGDRVLYEIL